MAPAFPGGERVGKTVLLVWLPLARLNRARPAAVFTKGILKDFLRLIVLLVGLLRRRLTVVRRRLEGDRRVRLRLAALKARQPFLKPILAYFFGSPGLGTQEPSREPHLS